jgi:uncharacterized protein (DUF362 family)
MVMKKCRRRCSGKIISRRDFLKGSALLGAGLMVGFDPKLENDIEHVTDEPPRIVRAYSPDATFWDYESEYYFDYVSQDVVDDMVLQGALELTERDLSRIMEKYSPGDTWAIKINCNNMADDSNEIDATAPVIIGVLRLLIEHLEVPPADIYVYDTSRSIPDSRIRNRIPYEINYIEKGDPLTRPDPTNPIRFRFISNQYLPYVVSQSQHLINIPLFKDHSQVLATLGFKNHFGTTRPSPSNLHFPIHFNLSDLNANAHIRDKTRLTVADALFGVWNGGPSGQPMQWETLPGGPTPNSIFMGFDPVALESVMVDYLIVEQKYHGVPVQSHYYLHDAMRHHKLGIHENKDENGNYRFIDYLEIEI